MLYFYYFKHGYFFENKNIEHIELILNYCINNIKKHELLHLWYGIEQFSCLNEILNGYCEIIHLIYSYLFLYNYNLCLIK